MAAAAKSPIVVVVMTGGAVDLTPIKGTANVGAIVWCGYPGQAGGQVRRARLCRGGWAVEGGVAGWVTGVKG